MIELSQSFTIEAAHTLRREIDATASRRIHGHSYRVELTLRGRVDPAIGMLCDLGEIAGVISDLRGALDHRLLDEVADLAPPTMENLARWVFERAARQLPALVSVTVERPTLAQRCRYSRGEFGEEPGV